MRTKGSTIPIDGGAGGGVGIGAFSGATTGGTTSGAGARGAGGGAFDSQAAAPASKLTNTR